MISSDDFHLLTDADNDAVLSNPKDSSKSLRRSATSSTTLELQPFPDVPLEQQPSCRSRYKACVPWCVTVCVCVCVRVCVCACVPVCVWCVLRV